MNGAIQVPHEEWTRLVQQVALAKASADAAKDAADNARQAAEKADAAINGKVWDHEARLRSLEQGHTCPDAGTCPPDEQVEKHAVGQNPGSVNDEGGPE